MSASPLVPANTGHKLISTDLLARRSRQRRAQHRYSLFAVATACAAFAALLTFSGEVPAAANTTGPEIHSYQPVGVHAAKAPPPVVSQSQLATGASGTQFIYADASWSGVSDGANVEMDIASPFLSASDGHSLGELAVQSSDGRQIVEVGWTVDRGTNNGDTRPHLFVFHWVDGKQTCYNGCGFIQASHSKIAGQLLSSGVRGSFAIEHYRGNWWVCFNDTWFGYFPDSLWDNQYTVSGLIQMFGEVAAVNAVPCTDMGNGRYASDLSSASMNAAVLNNSVPAFFSTFASNPALYSVLATGDASIRYGGPGAC
jgi:hypothetical protein